MMTINPENPLLKDAIKQALCQENEALFVCCDYDNCRFGIKRNNEKQIVQFGFTCFNFKQIYEFGGQYFIKKYYSDYILETENILQGFDMTVSITLQDKFKILKKIPKEGSPEDIEKIKQENNAYKKFNQDSIDKITKVFSMFRRHFYAGPIENAMDCIMKDTPKDQLKPQEYQTRPGERFWIVPDIGQVTFYFALSFQDIVDKALTKLILEEMVEAKRHVKNAPPIARCEDKYPETLANAFPSVKNYQEKYQNGYISITLFKKTHLTDQQAQETAATFLQGFRQYIHYHVHASKSYLHSRTVQRIDNFQKLLNFTKFETEEDKYFRTQKEQNVLVKDPANQEEQYQTKNIYKNK